MGKLIIIRHGQSTWNAENRFTGWVNVDLSEKGVLEAEKSGKLLKELGLEYDICFTSYLKRAIKTLEIVLKNAGKNSKYIKNRNDKGVFRVFVDRVFISKGFGSIITGTITSGQVKIGDKLKILPQNKEVKVRGLETQKEKVDRLEIGNRAAINIQTNEEN